MESGAKEIHCRHPVIAPFVSRSFQQLHDEASVREVFVLVSKALGCPGTVSVRIILRASHTSGNYACLISLPGSFSFTVSVIVY